MGFGFFAGKKEKLNVIMVLIDGAREDRVRCFPHFMQLIDRGSFFSTFIQHAPYTVASVFSTMTGMYGRQTAVNSYYSASSFCAGECKTLAERLKEAGYCTRGDTLSKIVCPEQGFDLLSIHDEDKDDLTQRHRAILQEMKQKNESGQRFFCFLHYSKIHAGVKVKVLKKFTNYSRQFFNNREKYESEYDKYYKEADDYLGAISAEIEKQGFFDNSLVVIFSDHGMSVGDKFGEKAYGTFCYDYTLRTFCIFIRPGIFPKKEFGQLVRNIDVAPTILDALGLDEKPRKQKISGVSVLPIIRGVEKANRIAFSETGNRYKEEKPPKKPNIKCIRTADWKLIYNMVPNSFELYSLKADHLEERNIAAEMPGKKEEILQAAREKLGFDPLEDY